MSKSHVLLLLGAFALSTSLVAVGADGDVEKAAGAAVEAVNADAKAVEAKAGENAKEIAEASEEKKEESGSWWSWLWPFGSDKVEDAEDAADVADVAEKGEQKAAGVVEVGANANSEEVPEPVVAENAEAGDADDDSMKRALLMYVPNLFMDLGDIFSMSLGVGAESGVEVRLTRWCQIGGMYGADYFVEKAYNRTYGGGYNDGYNFQLVPLASEVRAVGPTFGTTPVCIIKDSKARILSPDDKLYKDKVRDFWSVGVEGGWLIIFKFDIHPVEIADFFTGIVGYDLCEDKME